MGAWTCLFLGVLKDTPPIWKRGNRIANMTIVIMSTNQISYVTKPGPKCSSIWRKKILILGLKKMAYMWHYFSFSEKVGCYSKKHARGGESVIARRTSIHNQISQLSPQKGVAEVTVTNAQHVLYMPSKNRYRLLRNAQVDPILSLAVTHAYKPYYSLLDKQTPGRPPISWAKNTAYVMYHSYYW